MVSDSISLGPLRFTSSSFWHLSPAVPGFEPPFGGAASGRTPIVKQQHKHQPKRTFLVTINACTPLFRSIVYILASIWESVVDALITNFHLPRSSLLMLVSAFAGKEQMMNAYQQAKNARYRFFSFGDAMLIL